ncbi:DUF47 domain-containing protein [Leptolinea tardivitalis]|uniref:Phosphate transport regulator n=1 Tax=Leptolinea tardivitalis TaxID=229920 RepID=A0A0P6XGG8_9CHLR|nr:DUF47 family protein [Leptolinea tardivitalis]KPL70182.1 hypothetical protein ADM99_13355 [Leptolinea tardivitalis]GAP21707.1 phosphate transport regulator [Leptolinea tardivitalis]
MTFSDLFKQKPNKFMLMLIDQTEITSKGLELLTHYLKKRSSNVARQIVEIESQAEEKRRIMIEELMNTFVTPFDREDIFALSRDLDDILHYSSTTVEEMEILDVTPTIQMQKMAELLCEAVKELNLAVLRLQDKHYSVATEHANNAKRIENQVETTYREAIAELFQETKDVKHVINVLKVREIYRHLSNAADRQDQAANVISDIILKIA